MAAEFYDYPGEPEISPMQFAALERLSARLRAQGKLKMQTAPYRTCEDFDRIQEHANRVISFHLSKEEQSCKPMSLFQTKTRPLTGSSYLVWNAGSFGDQTATSSSISPPSPDATKPADSAT